MVYGVSDLDGTRSAAVSNEAERCSGFARDDGSRGFETFQEIGSRGSSHLQRC